MLHKQLRQIISISISSASSIVIMKPDENGKEDWPQNLFLVWKSAQEPSLKQWIMCV